MARWALERRGQLRWFSEGLDGGGSEAAADKEDSFMSVRRLGRSRGSQAGGIMSLRDLWPRRRLVFETSASVDTVERVLREQLAARATHATSSRWVGAIEAGAFEIQVVTQQR